MDSWLVLGRVVLLLAVAAAMGVLMRRLRQNVVIGYLLAGVLLGPTGFGVFGRDVELRQLGELGVALLLFSIGLEFSFSRLRQIGRVATVGGALQIVCTAAVIAALVLPLGAPLREAIVIAMALSVSSTAVVVRVLVDRAELDSPHGRTALGMLLMQDIAVVPLLLATEVLAQRSAGDVAMRTMILRLAAAVGFAMLLWLVVRFVMPTVLTRAVVSGSRELPVVVAFCASFGAAWAAHALGLSPALGAFVAGILLAESPFASQIRADVTPLSAVFITTFFAFIGTMVQLPAGVQLLAVAAAAAVVLAVKAAVTGLVVWLFQRSLRTAVGAGLALSQAGEFSFVLADVAFRQGVLDAARFQFVLEVSLLTLVATPYIIGLAPTLSSWVLRKTPVRRRRTLEAARPDVRRGRVIVIGFGPAGQQVVAGLERAGVPFLVLEMNPHTVAAHRSKFPIELGDATQEEILQHVGVAHARAVAITIPDPGASRLIVQQVKRYAPKATVIVRARYHQFAPLLEKAGAARLVDEEEVVGTHMAREILECPSMENAGAPAPAGTGDAN